MLLNETKPPLDEALAHYGVKGMKWGVRRAAKAEAKAKARAYRDMEKDLFGDDDKLRRKKIIAGTALAVTGVAVTAVMLQRSGHLKIPNVAKKVAADGKAERARAGKAARAARDKYKNSDFANRTFRPDEVRNPLWSRVPKEPRAARDFVDAGFGKDGVFNVTTMAKGSERVNNFSSDIWDIPMLELTSGRK